MKSIAIILFLFLCSITASFAQTLNDARKFYLSGDYEKALPVFEAEYRAKPTDAAVNQWYGVCLVETGGDLAKAEECLLVAANKKIRDSQLYLGHIYTVTYRFDEAKVAFEIFEKSLKKKGDEDARAKMEVKEKVLSRLARMASTTEDIQIIDSIVVDKSDFLSAYRLSRNSGQLKYFDEIFSSNKPVRSTVYMNEKGSKIYFGQPDTSNVYGLFSMEELLGEYGAEKKLSSSNFGLAGNVNYPFIMPDGVTIYFAADDSESIGGYDIFVSRYNMNNDTYLNPERLNMPFNSIYNDYMMAVDEDKGVGWFASDRFQPIGKVCVYTFIPNKTNKQIESEDNQYKANRAIVTAIKDSWIVDVNYNKIISLARSIPKEKEKVVRDFEFIINDNHTYYTLTEFKSKIARDTYFKVVQSNSELNILSKDLEDQRTAYNKAQPEEKRQMTNGILLTEKKEEQLKREITQLEIQARNEEIKDLKEAQF